MRVNRGDNNIDKNRGGQKKEMKSKKDDFAITDFGSFFK